MEINRPDGRTPNQLRPLACSRSVLHRAHGSASWAQGETKVLAAVYGPKAGTKKNENPEKASIEVIWKPKTGHIGKVEKEYEMILKKTLESICIRTIYPNTTTSIIVQVVHDDGALLPCAINAACAALVDAGIPLKHLAVAMCCSVSDSGCIVLDPNTSLFLSPHSFSFPTLHAPRLPFFLFSLLFSHFKNFPSLSSMEDCNDKKKRVRDDSHDSPESNRVDSPESKIRRVDSDSGLYSSESQLARVDSGESCHDSEVQLQDDIFNILDEADNVPERDSVQGLDSVIKSFEDEINAPKSDPGSVDPTQMPDGEEFQPNLGYLLEASDDELGLPPTVTPGEDSGLVGPDGLDLTGFMELEDDIPGYDAFGFGAGLVADCDGGSGGIVADALFDYAESAADVLWRSESLQAM